MGCKPPAWRQAQIPWAPPRNAENGIRTLAARMCCAGPGREEIWDICRHRLRVSLLVVDWCITRSGGSCCMQCTSASIFGLEAAALYLYYNRGSVVTCYDGSWEMCGGRRWAPATMTFFYSPPVGPSSRKYPLRSSVPSGKSLASAMSTSILHDVANAVLFLITRHRYFVGSAHLFHSLTGGIQLSVIYYMPATSLPDSNPSY